MLSLLLSCGIAVTAEFPVETYTLESNGLEVILSYDATLPIVAVNVWYHAGPVNEPPQRAGITRLLQRLMLGGGAHSTDPPPLARLRAAGATDTNSTVSLDRMNFFATVPAHQLELALWLEADRMRSLDSRLTQERIELERWRMIEEQRKISRQPQVASERAFYGALFKPGHPYHGLRADAVKRLTVEQVGSLYRRHCSPANATLAIVGHFDRQTIRETVARYFDAIPRRPGPEPRPIITTPLREETRLEIEEPTRRAYLRLGWLTPPFFARDDATAELLATLLADGPTSRLHRALVEETELAVSLSAQQQSLQLASVFSILVRGHRGIAPEEIESAIDRQLESLSRTPPSESELARAKTQILTRLIAGFERVGERADRFNRYNHYLGFPDALARDSKRYTDIRPEDLRAFAERLVRDGRVIVYTVPTR